MLNSLKSIYVAWRYESHTMDPYSRTERTRATCAVLLLLIGQWRMLRLRMPSVEFAFFVTADICECHLRSSGMMRPSMGCCLRVPGRRYSNCRRSQFCFLY